MDSTAGWSSAAFPARLSSRARSGVPVLEASAGGAAQRFAAALGRERHPATVFFVAMLGGLVLLTLCSVAAGYLLTDILGQVAGVHSANRSVDGVARVPSHTGPYRGFVDRLYRRRRRRSPGCRGSGRHGMRALPKVADRGLRSLCARRRVGGLPGHNLSLPRASPSCAPSRELAGERELPVRSHGSFDCRLRRSGAAPDLEIPQPGRRAIGWPLAVAVSLYVALSRLYRGMHYPLDAAGGALLGVAALCVVVFACRAAGAAEHRRSSG